MFHSKKLFSQFSDTSLGQFRWSFEFLRLMAVTAEEEWFHSAKTQKVQGLGCTLQNQKPVFISLITFLSLILDFLKSKHPIFPCKCPLLCSSFEEACFRDVHGSNLLDLMKFRLPLFKVLSQKMLFLVDLNFMKFNLIYYFDDLMTKSNLLLFKKGRVQDFCGCFCLNICWLLRQVL